LLPARHIVCLWQISDRAQVPRKRQTRNEVIDKSADASRPAAGRKLDTKPVGNGGDKIPAAE